MRKNGAVRFDDLIEKFKVEFAGTLGWTVDVSFLAEGGGPQDNVLLPDDFAENTYQIGNAHEMLSIIKSGLIPGGRSLRRDRQSVFFTSVNPMCARKDLEEFQYDLNKPRIAVYKNTVKKSHQQPVYWWCLVLGN